MQNADPSLVSSSEDAGKPTTELTKPLPDPIARGRFRIVDADAHIDPPHTFWADYLPEHLKDQAPIIEEGDECDFVVFEGRKRPLGAVRGIWQSGCDPGNQRR